MQFWHTLLICLHLDRPFHVQHVHHVVEFRSSREHQSDALELAGECEGSTALDAKDLTPIVHDKSAVVCADLLDLSCTFRSDRLLSIGKGSD